MSRASSSIKPSRQALAWLFFWFSLGGVVAVHLSWQVHPVAALTNNAFDLAEWISLHPTTQAENPALLSSILLRLPLVLLALSIALASSQLSGEKARWIGYGLAWLVALRLNPPVDFYRSPSSVSLNERHLGYLTFIGLGAVGAVMLIRRIWPRNWGRIAYPLLIGVWLAILFTSWSGLNRATHIVESLQVQVNYGAGIYTITALALGVIGLGGWHLWQEWRGNSDG